MYNDEPLFIIRNIASGRILTGTHTYAVPKLYKIGSAKRVCNKLNDYRIYNHNKGVFMPIEDPYEIVPVTMIYGSPLASKTSNSNT